MATTTAYDFELGARSRPPISARQSTLRESNLALVCQTVLAAPEPLSRADVAARTSLTRSTVSRLVDDLVAGEVLAELGQAQGKGRGRPATPLVAGSGLAALGLQVNATFLAARVVDLRGRVIAERIHYDDLVASQPAPTLARLGELSADILTEIASTVRLVGAGLALPGIVSTRAGRLLLAPNLGWADVEPVALADQLGRAGLTLRVGNEADLAARTVAEVAPGRSSALRDFLYLSGEIGIGGAAFVDGELMPGRHGWAGEIGHVCVDPEGPTCPCGSTGCLEQYAGRRALLAAAGLPPQASPDTLAEAARMGERRAHQSVARAADALGVALAGVVNILDIPAIVLGGDLGRIADVLAPELDLQLQRRTLSARWVIPTIQTAGPDPAPGATGAALRELSDLLAHPAAWLA